ncbi:MAG: hypothetical protein CMM34_01760 [Rhodospirillaceae bacterium]|nr:hypothetical protein [Rhodospirillaceae bacterium]
MPQMEFADYMPQVVWLVITFATLYVLMAKLALPRITDILETRQRHLEHDLELSEKLRDEAQTTLAEYDAAIVSARAETESLLAKARESIQTETQERIAELNGRLESEIRESDARIRHAMSQAMDELVVVAGNSARAAVERLAGIKVSDEQARVAVESVRNA